MTLYMQVCGLSFLNFNNLKEVKLSQEVEVQQFFFSYWKEVSAVKLVYGQSVNTIIHLLKDRSNTFLTRSQCNINYLIQPSNYE